MAIGHGSGKEKAKEAAEAVISSPLLETSISGAFKDDMQDEMTITVIAAGFGGDDFDKDIDDSDSEETADTAKTSSGMKEEVISVDNPLLSSLGLNNDKSKNNNSAPAETDDDLDAILKMLGS